MSSVKFRAELTDFKIIHNVLKAIAFKEFAIIHPMEEGLKVTVDEVKCVETSVYIPSELFNSYHVDPNEDIKFKLSLKVLTECLHIYGDDGSPSLKLSYKNAGLPLCLVIKHNEENVSVDCEIQTMDAEDFSDLSLAEECTANKVVLAAAPLVEVLGDLDQTSDELRLVLSPDPPYFRISATCSTVCGTSGGRSRFSLKRVSLQGEAVIDISRHSDMVTVFQCSKTTKFSYVFSYIRQILKVMGLANKISVSTSETGLLGLQLVVNTSEKQIFVEYYVTALYL